MKKWHMEGIVIATGRLDMKLEIPQPGKKTIWSDYPLRKQPEKALSKAFRSARQFVLRQEN